MWDFAPCLLDELGIPLSESNQTLHASFYYHEHEFVPSGVSVHRFYVEYDPRGGIRKWTKNRQQMMITESTQ